LEFLAHAPKQARLLASGMICSEARRTGGCGKLALYQTDNADLTAMLPVGIIHGVEIYWLPQHNSIVLKLVVVLSVNEMDAAV